MAWPTTMLLILLSITTADIEDCNDGGYGKVNEFYLLLIWIYVIYGAKMGIVGVFIFIGILVYELKECCEKAYKQESETPSTNTINQDSKTKASSGATRQGHLALSKEAYDPSTFLMDTCVLCRTSFNLNA